jgi:hypothetical protein
MRLDSTSARIVLIEPGGALAGQWAGVSPAVAKAAATAVLEAHPGEAMGQALPVRLLGLEDIPEGVVVIDTDLARRLELDESTRATWALRTRGFLRQEVEELELEATVERPLDQLVDELSRDRTLSGRLLLARGEVAAGNLWIEVAGQTFRVRQLRPAPAAGEWIYETGPQTRFSLFAPALRSSVDVVILADCSGSMSCEDILDTADPMPEPPAAAPPPPPKRSFLRSLFGFGAPREAPAPVIRPIKTLRRTEALKRALDNLLEVRLRTPGRVSRIALVAFTERCQTRFPRGGGMIEMDENAPPELVQQFQDAIARLQPENAGTSIGNALNYAAELLDKHGRPGNDRLIVLLSDGADWKPKSGDDAGELVRGVDEPVSLMEDLHQRMRISLHALGISNEAIFWPWWKRNYDGAPSPGIIPNHKLLEALVEVGGGDPTRTGDAAVLADYLSGLGQGVSRRLNLHAHPVEKPRLKDAERARLRERLATLSRSRAAAESQARRDQLCEEIHTLFRAVNEYGRSLAGQDVFRVSTDSIEVLHKLMFEPTRNKREFDWWWRKMHQQFLELRDVRIWAEKQPPYPVPGVKERLHGEETAALNHLRNWCSHHWLAPGDEKQRKDFARSLERVREILLELTGRPVLEDDDETAWVTLQLAVLQRLRDVLAASVDVFRSASSSAREPRPAKAAAGMIFVG